MERRVGGGRGEKKEVTREVMWATREEGRPSLGWGGEGEGEEEEEEEGEGEEEEGEGEGVEEGLI